MCSCLFFRICAFSRFLLDAGKKKGKGKGKQNAGMSPKTPEAKSDAVEADRVGGRRVGTHAKKKKKHNKKGGKDDGKRKLVRGIMPKNCVMCRMHSDDVPWGHPRHAKGVEGSECYWCRRCHRAKANACLVRVSSACALVF